MNAPALRFEEADLLGHVAAVDTSRILLDANNPSKISRAGVGNIVAIKGAVETEFLVGIVEKITRTLREGFIDDEDDASFAEPGEEHEDVVRVLLIGTYRTVHGDRTDVFKRGADSFPQIDRECFLVSGGNLQRFMGLLGANLGEGERLELGRFVIDPDAHVIASGDRLFQRHAAILGSTGSGKSWTVALILERASRLSYPNVIVLDMHGEYSPLAAEDDGFARQLRIAGPGAPSEDETLFLPYWLLNREEMLSMILDRNDQNAPNQASRFTKHVRDLKRETLKAEEKTDVEGSFTVDSPIPYSLEDLIQRLRSDNEEMVPGAGSKPKMGPWNGKLTRFLARLEAKVQDRRYGFLFQPPAPALRYEWLAEQAGRLLGSGGDRRGIKVVDFSEVPSDVLPIVAGTFARLLYDVQFWIRQEKRTPFCLVCDEAHLYLPVRTEAGAIERQALAAFERIAKEGRKYGVSLLVVSQRPVDVSKTILSQCNNFIVLRLTNDADQAVVKRLMPDSMAGLTETMPLLDIGEALVLGDAVLLPTRVRLDSPTIKPNSATRPFWQDWGQSSPELSSIKEAVETLRRQTRPSS